MIPTVLSGSERDDLSYVGKSNIKFSIRPILYGEDLPVVKAFRFTFNLS